MMFPVFRLTVFFALITSVFAAGTLDALVIAAQGFALAIQQQLAAVQSITTPAELAEKTISYAAAKTAYYEALRAAAPELMAIATGKKPRPPEVDRFAQSFGLAGEKQEKVVDEANAVLLGKLPLDSDIQKAKAAFDQARSVEEGFQRDFTGVDFTNQ
jgi:creatinine amidohydrolase/Fe(II)-dependent formamide hydrolase-like protein